jgi:uncharacterized protein Smg (DUF494 family)
MKDSLFEMLLNLFEKTLTQLKEKHLSSNTNTKASNQENQIDTSSTAHQKTGVQLEFIKRAGSNSLRVFTPDEQLKLTKASYQFLVRLMSWGIIAPELQELIINRLVFSESRFVSLQETKWTIRNTLADTIDAEQLAFLELVLYQKEDGLPLH